MAKKVKAAASKPRKPRAAKSAEAEQQPAQAARPVGDTTSKSQLEALLKKLKGPEKDAADARGSMGGAIANAVENQKLHKKAFATIRWLLRQTEVKQAEFLFHLDTYVEHLGLDKQDEMFPRGGEDEGGADESDEQQTDIEDPQPQTGGRRRAASPPLEDSNVSTFRRVGDAIQH